MQTATDGKQSDNRLRLIKVNGRNVRIEMSANPKIQENIQWLGNEYKISRVTGKQWKIVLEDSS